MNEEGSQEYTINSPVESIEGDIIFSESINSPVESTEGEIIFSESEGPISTGSSLLTVESQGLRSLQRALTMATSTTEITMPDETKIEVHDKAQAINDLAEFVQITSTERLKLDAKQQADLRCTIIRKQHDIFKKMDLASTNLDELVGFQVTLESAERHFEKFDLHQIFNIVEPDMDSRGNILPSLKPGSGYRNLFQWYAVLKVESPQATNGIGLFLRQSGTGKTWG
jgi:hypothetical protein